MLKNFLEDMVIWIDTKFIDDRFGDLDAVNTIVGLHLSNCGYRRLESYLKKYILEGSMDEVQ